MIYTEMKTSGLLAPFPPMIYTEMKWFTRSVSPMIYTEMKWSTRSVSPMIYTEMKTSGLLTPFPQ